MSSQTTSAYPEISKDVRYGEEHALQNLDICLPRPAAENPPGSVWVIFIHGGAWNDPLQDKAELQPALTKLLDRFSDFSSNHGRHRNLRRIAGLASINYALSARGSERDGDGDGGRDDPSRNAAHPQHVRDILKALAWLGHHHGVGTRLPYALVGHSCGATLAFQVVMDQRWEDTILSSVEIDGVDGKMRLRLPVAVVGVEGIYDIPLMVHNHAGVPAYRDFVVAAFGEDEEVWRRASSTAGSYADDGWCEGRVVVLAQSPDDELIEGEQVDVMAEALTRHGWRQRRGTSGTSSKHNLHKELVIAHLQGSHDEIWQQGTELLRAIELALGHLFKDEACP